LVAGFASTPTSFTVRVRTSLRSLSRRLASTELTAGRQCDNAKGYHALRNGTLVCISNYKRSLIMRITAGMSYTKLRCGTDVQGTVVDLKHPSEADLINGVCDPKPPNSRRAIRLSHPCVDVYVSNPQATVVARSDCNGAGRMRGRAVAEIHARVRGATADRLRGRAPWRGCSNRFGTRRRLAVSAIGGIRSRARLHADMIAALWRGRLRLAVRSATLAGPSGVRVSSPATAWHMAGIFGEYLRRSQWQALGTAAGWPPPVNGQKLRSSHSRTSSNNKGFCGIFCYCVRASGKRCAQ
jgi:hypothetical protein